MKTHVHFKWAMLVMAVIFLSSFSNSSELRAQTGNALNFDGTDDYVNISPVVPFTSNFTIEGWIKTTDASAKLFVWGSPTVNGHVYLGLNLGKLRLAYGDGIGIDQLDGLSTVSDNVWHHIAVVKSGTAVTCYLDGIQNGTGTTTRNPGSVTNSSIGGGLINGTLQGFTLGTIDEVRVWNVARTGTQIQNNKNCELNAQAGLVAAYHFNNGVANGNNIGFNLVADASGNNQTGTLTNFALTGSTSNWTNSSSPASAEQYRSVASGDWGNLSTWEFFNGCTWQPALNTPNYTHSSIVIRVSFPFFRTS